jgi:hypothetical protein
MPSNNRGYEECPNYGVIEAMLDLPSLPDTVKKEAAQSAVRMLDEIKPKAVDMQGHLEIYRDLKEIMELQVLSDKTTLKPLLKLK